MVLHCSTRFAVSVHSYRNYHTALQLVLLQEFAVESLHCKYALLLCSERFEKGFAVGGYVAESWRIRWCLRQGRKR
jgi:hypothetical protein